ncbi:DUF4198 domain-containing protein [Agaribacterium sp. ZY112]|uniref:DUF4198 domain-containing protein n=1 Tax=Agaribacterium sp. ZY112 TaxID=3233574 RepID=UPI00352564BB
MKFKFVLVLVSLLVSVQASAHKRWFLPSDFSLSDAEFITVDFTASNNVFYVDKAMPLSGVKVYSPSMQPLELKNTLQGERRSSFDVELKDKGTYRIVSESPAIYFSSYIDEKGETVRNRGTLEALKKSAPKDAKELKFARAVSTLETYVSLGSGSKSKPSQAEGIQLVMHSHVNELYSDEPAQLVFVLNGKPAQELKVSVVAEGTRYRDDLDEKHFKTDEQGKVSIDWPHAGRFLIEAQTAMPSDKDGIAMQFYTYYLSVEVLKP